ncbi:unnamed protein product [Blepharisma stoltei]|uniref:Ras-related protein n=1 Tax=Blepharisma stoltei TaxID=1481888 RepID=A0AAU9J7Y7_9CILI|nr:unnamed protein product [Blepharisma stoltei]
MSFFYKIAVLGAGGVGKSDLVLRFTQDRFEDNWDPTIEDQYTTTFELDGFAVRLEILDTAGQEDFSHLLDIYLQEREAYLLVYSLTDASTLEKVCSIATFIFNTRGANTPIIFVGNKSDLEKEICIEKGAVSAYIESFKYAACYETSAKFNTNVKEAFYQLVRLLWKRNKERNCDIGISDIGIELPIPEETEKRKKCCIFF